jgi:hypothetical protein
MKLEITEENIGTLIQNGNIYLEDVNGNPVGGEDYDVLTFAPSFSARLATVQDIPSILKNAVKTVYVRGYNSPVTSFVGKENVIAEIVEA